MDNCAPAPGTVVQVCGTIEWNTTWTPANVYSLTCSVTIPAGVTLTIQPGTIVKLGLQTDLVVNGTLNSQGTASQQIYFTSIRDDQVGGDSNGDGNATSPAPSDWQVIQLNDGGAATIDYTTVRYGGYGGFGVLYSPTYTIPTLVSGNVILQHNTVNGIQLPGVTLSKPSYSLPYQHGVAYYLSGSVTVPVGTALTVAPGAILKFGLQTGLNISGSLTAQGTSALPIYFTSIRDDQVGGDSNDDGTATNPGVSDWAEIAFGDGSASTIDYATIRYGGYGGYAVLYAGAFTVPTLVSKNVHLTQNWANGIQLPGVTLSHSSYDLIYQQGVAYYVSGNVSVPTGTTLTVAPGAILKFGLQCNLLVNGALTAQGTSALPIYFTSIRDDQVGGDTNDDSDATGPASSNWGEIQFAAGSSSTIDYAAIRYGGYGGYAVLYAGAYTIPTLVSGNVSLTQNWANGIQLPGGTLPNSSYTLPYFPSAPYYISGSITVPSGTTLKVVPGAILKFGLQTGLNISGSLTAQGTSALPIYFTSFRDDAVGGDTNGDGTATSPGVGDWAEVSFAAGSSSTIDYATIRYGGYGGYAVLYAGAYTVPTLVSSNVNLTLNELNAIQLPGITLSKPSYSLPNQQGVAYYISGDVTVPAGTTLTVQPGAILKFGLQTAITVNGTLTAQGTAAQKIYLTSIRDDSIGGDTNGDGTATSPAAGNWDQIFVSDASASLAYATVRYGGYSGNGALHLNNGTLGVTSTCLMTNNIGLYATTVGASVTSSSIFGNANYGVYSTVTSPPVVATNDWWGAASGPYPGGTGDHVTSGVNFTPFLTAAALTCP